jgi:hypothetical protein
MKHRVQQGKKFFCTECGSDLDDFWVSPGADAYADILKNHMECQRTGKFKGSMCSKLFIADGTTPTRTASTSKLSQKRVAHLKKSVMKKIADEETKKRS